jgi:hypothetical protein
MSGLAGYTGEPPSVAITDKELVRVETAWMLARAEQECDGTDSHPAELRQMS